MKNILKKILNKKKEKKLKIFKKKIKTKSKISKNKKK